MYKSFSILRPLTDLRIVDDLLYMGFKSGDTDIFHWNESEKELLKFRCEKMDEHEEELMCIDILLREKILVSGGKMDVSR